MVVRFWGVRGSIPSPPKSSELQEKILRILEFSQGADLSTSEKRKKFLDSIEEQYTTFLGGNTPCVELQSGSTRLIFDMGSGLRDLGREIMHTMGGRDIELHMFVGHTHWDHIQGFPFFIPAYSPKTTINFYHRHPDLKGRLEGQQQFQYFPVSLDIMLSKRIYNELTEGQILKINDLTVRNIELNHPGKAFGYRVEKDGKSFVYASDSEYSNLPSERIKKYIEFYQGTDVLIFDAPYSFSEEIEKINWGHSSAIIGTDLAVEAKVKKLVLFHHAPENDDEEVYRLLNTALTYKSRNYPDSELSIVLAREGSDINI